jgi:transposase
VCLAQLPADFPPWQTVYWYFVRWEQAKATEKILPVVRAQLGLREGRDPEPSAGLIDSQSVKGADTVGRDCGCQKLCTPHATC